jgi:hypothetical protein
VHGVAELGSSVTVQEDRKQGFRLEPGLCVKRAAYFPLGASGCGSAVVHVLGTHTTGSATMSTESPRTLLWGILFATDALQWHVATNKGGWCMCLTSELTLSQNSCDLDITKPAAA